MEGSTIFKRSTTIKHLYLWSIYVHSYLNVYHGVCPLVNIHISMENPHFQWNNSLFQWPCAILILKYQKVYPIKSHQTAIFLRFSYGFTAISHGSPPFRLGKAWRNERVVFERPKGSCAPQMRGVARRCLGRAGGFIAKTCWLSTEILHPIMWAFQFTLGYSV